MSNIIEDFYYGNIEPQEVDSELTSKLKKKLSQLAEKEEQLKADNQMEWVAQMNNVEASAREIVNKEMIYN